MREFRNGVEVVRDAELIGPNITDATITGGTVAPAILNIPEGTPVNAVAATGTVTFTGLPNVYVANVNSTGTITVSGTPVAEEVFDVGTQTFTFKETRASAGQVTINADNTQQAVNIVDAITADVSAEATATNLAGVVTVTAVADGVAGDSVVLTATATGIAVSGSGTLSGGVDEVLETTTVDDKVFKYVTLRSVAEEVTVGADETETATNFKTAVNTDMTTVDADSSLGVVSLTAATAGVAGNAIVLTESATNTAVSGSGTLAGGVNGTVATANTTFVDADYIYHTPVANTISGANWEMIPIRVMTDPGVVGLLNMEHNLFVDGNRTDTYTPDGGISRPYKTIVAALTAINADAAAHAAAGHYELTNYVLNIAPGTYADNLTITNEKYLKLVGVGVFITGTVAITQTQQSGDYYSRLEFCGADGIRSEKGPAFKLAGNITATRNNDSLTYINFKGCWITGNTLFETDGTWVVHYEGCRVAGTIGTGTFADADSAVLIETSGFNEFAGAISDKVSFYTVDGAAFYGAIAITPIFDCRITNSTFASSVSIVATKNLDVDAIGLKNIVDRTPTLTGMTIRQLEQVASETYAGVTKRSSNADVVTGTATDTAVTPANLTARLAAPGPIGGTTQDTAAFTSVNWAKPANIADSATPAIGAAAGNIVDLDGTTTITGFDTVAAGVTRLVSFTGVRTLTHNAVSLILPGAGNILTAAGDRAIFVSLGSGNWRCHEYLKTSGLAIGRLDEQVVASSGTLSRSLCFGGLVNSYGHSNDAVIVIPAAEKGMNFTVILGTTVAKYYRLDPNASDSIYLDGVTTGDGKYVGVASAAVGNCIQFIAYQTGAAAYDWEAVTVSGPWVAEA